MNRRDFLKAFGVGGTTALVAPSASASSNLYVTEVPLQASYAQCNPVPYKAFHDCIEPDDVDIFPSDGLIQLKTNICGNALYSYLAQLWEQNIKLLSCDFPMIGVTNDFFQMAPDWNISRSSLVYLKSTALSNNYGESYVNMYSLGSSFVPENTSVSVQVNDNHPKFIGLGDVYDVLVRIPKEGIQKLHLHATGFPEPCDVLKYTGHSPINSPYRIFVPGAFDGKIYEYGDGTRVHLTDEKWLDMVRQSGDEYRDAQSIINENSKYEIVYRRGIT